MEREEKLFIVNSDKNVSLTTGIVLTSRVFTSGLPVHCTGWRHRCCGEEHACPA